MTNHSFLENPIESPEIVIGLVSPVGANVTNCIATLRQQFDAMGYDFHHVKVSSLFEPFAASFPKIRLDTSTKIKRVNSFIDLGNRLRKQLGNDILAALAIAEIIEARFASQNEESFEGRVFVIDQLKTEAELALLREVYGPGFFQISVYSARDIRVDNLAKDEAHSNLVGDKNRFRHSAEKLVTRDEDERGRSHGQKVGRIFQLADFVVNADRIGGGTSIDRQIERFVELLFSSNVHSPSRAEYGMYLAHSAALRSLDLSRQVGAAIFRETGEIAALGSNEVPRAGGGTYWADGEFDAREYKLGKDSNDTRKEELLQEVMKVVKGKSRLTNKDVEKLKDTQFMDALEYGRIVHAEMCALTDAARLGISVSGATLYCTTFPCHMCAKHIVASGLRRVVFLEPYPKSLTSDMHSDAVSIEGTSRGVYEKYPSVEFIPFHGITPRRYREIFSRAKRKSDAKFQVYRDGKPKPIFSIVQPWYANREVQVLMSLEAALRSFVS